jgi:hypothetical protein
LYLLASKLVTASAPLNFIAAMSYASAASTSVAGKMQEPWINSLIKCLMCKSCIK